MTGRWSPFSTDALDVVPVIIVILMLALSASTLAYDRILGSLLGIAHLATPPDSRIVEAAAVGALAALPLAFLRIWPDELLGAISYLAWLLYLPSALYYSGIDVFRILSISANFSIFESRLSFTAIVIAGILIACGSLASRSIRRLKKTRGHLLQSGADPGEARRALSRNALFEIRLTAIVGVLAILFAFIAPYAGQKIQASLETVGYAYLLAGLGAIVLLALVLILSLWPRGANEKE